MFRCLYPLCLLYGLFRLYWSLYVSCRLFGLY
nr:MAG TPA: hypothetical protein [Caudoviricetes sp.]